MSKHGKKADGSFAALVMMELMVTIVPVERLTCVAKWKEGNKRYFVALVNSLHSQWAEELDRYQCFLYEDISNTMRMAQGQFSASCQGLWSVLEGSRTFSLQKREFAPSDINN